MNEHAANNAMFFAAITSSLGLTNEDINDIYKDRSDESLSPDDDVAKQNGDGKKELVSKAGLSGSDEELSSAWDDEELSGKPPVEGKSCRLPHNSNIPNLVNI